MTRWLITGGCGFIGRKLIAGLLRDKSAPVAIRVFDNLSVGTREELEEVTGAVVAFRAKDAQPMQAVEGVSSVELAIGDIRHKDEAEAAISGADIIVHLAANTGVGPSVENPLLDCESNVLGTLHCLEAGRKTGAARFVFASSGAPIGEAQPPLHEELPAHPVSPYGASKLAGEAYCSAYYRTFGLETVCLRFSNVYGPGSGHKASVVAKFIKAAKQQHPLTVFGDGEQTRDYIFINDLVRAICLAASSENVGGEIFQIATGIETTINALLNILVPELKAQGFKGIRIENKGERLGDVRQNFADISKARKHLKWSPETRLEDGIAATVAWFLSTSDSIAQAD